MIFVDTSAWFAAYVEVDANYFAASAFLASVVGDLITTDYIVAETLNLFRARRRSARAMSFGDIVFDAKEIVVEQVSSDDLKRAWLLFRHYGDKHWSFTDCTSFAMIERLGIKTAFAFDQHFHQFGNVEVVPVS